MVAIEYPLITGKSATGAAAILFSSGAALNRIIGHRHTQ